MKTIVSDLLLKGRLGLLLMASIFISQMGFAQATLLTGKVLDFEGPLHSAVVKASKNGVYVYGVTTDFDGKFQMQLDSGFYDIEISLTAYLTQKINKFQVLLGQVNVLPDVKMADRVLQEITIHASMPVAKEQHQSAQMLTSDQISNVPTKSVNAVMGSTAGVATKKSSEVKVKGSRSEATAYYVDGVKISNARKPHSATSDINAPGTPAKNLRLDSLPREFSPEHYNQIIENPFQESSSNNISTFSIDVDVAAYSNMRRFINQGTMPPKDAIRIEEMINYFDYQYDTPKGKHPFEAQIEVAPCPWNESNRLMMIGLQGEKIDVGQLPASNFVFLIDVSGSMESVLPLVQQSLSLLTDYLRPSDKVSIVVYAGAAGMVLPPTGGAEKLKIKNAINALRSGGSTAGGAGIQLAYSTARSNFIPRGNNRVILCTDGDFNVGVSSEDDLVKLIEKERESGVYLSVLGYGAGNYQDGKMQVLADKGNGNHSYIDQLSEANKVLINEFGGTLFAIAKDVKLQLHFNPELVAGYRLIGYENRLLATEDFHDDTKDAGELGAGHRVTALYELVPKGQQLPALSKLDSALVMVQAPDKSVKLAASDLVVLQMRYKKPKGNSASELMEYRLNAAALERKKESENFKLASAVAEYGLLLRDSKYKGSASYKHALSRAREVATFDLFGYRLELVDLIEKAGKMASSVK